MKIALELQPCCGQRSGIGNYAYELSKRLKNQDGLEFYGNLFNFLGRHNNAEELQGFSMQLNECHLLPAAVYRRIGKAIPIPYQKLFPVSADLSIFYNYIVPPRMSGKVVDTICDMTYMRYPETMDVRNHRRLKAGLEDSVARSDHFITISEFSKREMMELMQIPEDRITIIPCAPQPAAKAEPFETVAEKYQIKKPYILYVGTIEPRKNLVRLIHAFETLKKEEGIAHQLVLAGGKGWSNEQIYQTAENSFCRDEIIFTDYISNQEKSTLYLNADVFVFPSLYEGFGIPPLEAMALDCPVVCADAASLPEVVGDAAGLADPMNETALAEAIHRVLTGAEYRETLINKGRERLKLFSWDKSADLLVDLCKKVME